MANGFRDRATVGQRFLEEERQRPRHRTLGQRLLEEDTSPVGRIEGGVAPDDPPTLRRGVTQAMEEMRGSFLGDRAIVQQLVGNEERSRELQEQAGLAFENAQRSGPRVQTIGDIQNIEDLANFIIGGFGRVLPSAGLAVASGGVGGAVGGALVRQAGKEAVKRSLRRRAKKRGATTGLVATSVPQESGAIFAEIDEDPDTDLSRTEQAFAAIGGGTLAGALDVLPQMRVLSKALPPSKLKKARSGIISEIAKQAGAEGVTEASQELIAKATNKYIDDNVELFDENTLNELGTAFALGVIGGSSLGGVSTIAQNFLADSDVELPGFMRQTPRQKGPGGENLSAAAGILGRSAEAIGRTSGAVKDEVQKLDRVVRAIFSGRGGFERASLDADTEAIIRGTDLEELFINNESFREAVEDLDPTIAGSEDINERLFDLVTRIAERADEQTISERAAVEQETTPGVDEDGAIQEEQVQASETGISENVEGSNAQLRGRKGASVDFAAPVQKREGSSFRKGLQPNEELVSFDQAVDEAARLPSELRSPSQRDLVGDEDARTPAQRQALREKAADRLIEDLEQRGVNNLEELKALRAENTNKFLSQFELAQSAGPFIAPDETTFSPAQIRDIRRRGQKADPRDTKGLVPIIGQKTRKVAEIDEEIRKNQLEGAEEGKRDPKTGQTPREARIKRLEELRKEAGKQNQVSETVRLDPRAIVANAINANPSLKGIENKTERTAKAFAEGVSALIKQGVIDTVQPIDDSVVVFPKPKDGPGRDIRFAEIKTNDEVTRLREQFRTSKSPKQKKEIEAKAKRIKSNVRKRTERRNELLSVEGALNKEERAEVRQALAKLTTLRKEKPGEFVLRGGEGERIRLERMLKQGRAISARIEAEEQIEIMEHAAQHDEALFQELGGEAEFSRLRRIVNPFKDYDREVYDSSVQEQEAVGADATEAYYEDGGRDAFDLVLAELRRAVRDRKRLGGEVARIIQNDEKPTKRLSNKLEAAKKREKGLRDTLDLLAQKALVLSVDNKIRGVGQVGGLRVGTIDGFPVIAPQGTSIPLDTRFEEKLKTAIKDKKQEIRKLQKQIKGAATEERKRLAELQDELIELQREANDLVDGTGYKQIRVGDLEEQDYTAPARSKKQRDSANKLRKAIIETRNKLKYAKGEEAKELRFKLDAFIRAEKGFRGYKANDATEKETAREYVRRVDFLNELIRELEEDVDTLTGILVGDERFTVDEILGRFNKLIETRIENVLAAQAREGQTMREFLKDSTVKKTLYRGTQNAADLGLPGEANVFYLSESRSVAETYTENKKDASIVSDDNIVSGETILNAPSEYSNIVEQVTFNEDGTVEISFSEEARFVKGIDLLELDFDAPKETTNVERFSSKDEAVSAVEKAQFALFYNKNKGGIHSVKVALNNPVVLDFKGNIYSNPPSSVFEELSRLGGEDIARGISQGMLTNTDSIIDIVQQINETRSTANRFDGITFKNIVDDGIFAGENTGEASTNHVVFSADQVWLLNRPERFIIPQEVGASLLQDKRRFQAEIERAKAEKDSLSALLDENRQRMRSLASGMEVDMPRNSLDSEINPRTREAWVELKREINAYLERTVGKRARFRKNLPDGVSGQFDPVENVIYLSYNAFNPFTAAYHESLHYAFHNLLTQGQKTDLTAFFGKKRNLKRLVQAVRDSNSLAPSAKERIIELISHDSGLGVEERSAYAYQLWMRGEFQVAPATNRVFQFIRDITRNVLGILAKSDRADLIFKALRDGDLARAKQSNFPWQYPGLDDTSIKRAARVVEGFTKDYVRPVMEQYVTPVAVWGKLNKNPVVKSIMSQLVRSPLDEDTTPAYMEVKNQRMRRFAQEWFEGTGWEDLSPQQQRAVRDHIYSQKAVDDIQDSDVREYVAEWRGFMDKLHKYMNDAGLDTAYVESYFPRVWDLSQLYENKDQFIEMMGRHTEELKKLGLTPETAYDAILKADGSEISLPDILVSMAEKKFTKEGLPPELARELSKLSVKEINEEIARLSEQEDRFVAEGNEQELHRVSQKKQAYELWANNVMGTYVNAPGSMATKSRVFKFLDNEDLSPFLHKDFEVVMQTYINSVVKRAEYARRFGRNGEKLKKMVAEARQLGLSPKEEELLDEAIAAVRGTLGTNINPRFRKISSWLITYQNFRLLALSAFTAMADVSGILMRSQDIGIFWNSIKTAHKNIAESMFPRAEIKRIKKRISELNNKESLTKEGTAELRRLKKEKREMRDRMQQIAEELGVIDTSILHASLNSRFGSEFMYSKAETANNMFFKYTGLEYVTNMTRLMASSAAISFIKSHAVRAGEGNEQSVKFLKELNLTKDDIATDDEGELITKKESFMAKGATEQEAVDMQQKMEIAVNRFVDQAIPRPNAGDRPAQLSNPHLMLILHLKQFIFTFQTQMLNRVGKQALEGNYKPAIYLMSFIPVIMAVDALRHTVQYWWDDPDWDDDWTPADHVFYAAQRGGLLGMTEFAVDISRNLGTRRGTGLEALGGPTVEQSMDLLRSSITGNPGNMQTFTEALPAQNFYKNWPIFQDGET